MARYRFDEIVDNSTAKKKPVEEDKYTYLGLEHLDSKNLKVCRFGSDVAPIGEKLIMKKGDVLFGKRRAYQKKVAIAPFDGIFSAHGMVLRPKEDIIDKDFFPLFISSDYFLDEAIKISVGSLSPTINWRDLKELSFELPDLVTQRKLAKVLWAMNATLEAYRNLLQSTEELVKSQFIEQFMTIHNYEKRKLMDVCQLSKGVQINGEDLLKNGEYAFYNGGIEPSGYWNVYNVEGNSISISEGGNSCGFVNYQPNNYWCGAHCYRLYDLNVDTYFLYYQLKTREKQIMDLRSGACMPNIKKSTLENFEIVVPPDKLQIQYSLFAKQIDKSKFELNQTINELEATYIKIITDNLH